MDTQPIFTLDIWKKYNFLNNDEIDLVINSIVQKDLLDYNFFKGSAKSTYVAMQEQNPNILDFHSAIQKKILREVSTAAPNQRMADSWCNIQGRDSTLEWHNHPNSVISGIIFLKCDEHSSKLVFKNPLTPRPPTAVSPHEQIYELTPEKGLLVMWPSYLMNGSGGSVNQSDERIVLSFNTYWK